MLSHLPYTQAVLGQLKALQLLPDNYGGWMNIGMERNNGKPQQEEQPDHKHER